MKKLRNLSIKRTMAGAAAFGIFAGVLMTLAGSVLTSTARPVSAQGATFTWINAGTISFNGATYYNVDITATNDYINTTAGDCAYNGKTVHKDMISVKNNTPNADYSIQNIDPAVGTHHSVRNPDILDAAQNPTCSVQDTAMTGTNTSNSNVLFYRSGDTVTSYNGSVSYVKKSTVNADGSTGVEVFIQSDQLQEPCPDVLVHGTNGSGDYGNSWFDLPMTDQNQGDASKAISEKYTRLGFPNGPNCRVNNSKLIQQKLGTATNGSGDPDAGVNADLTNINGFTIMFGDDAFRIDGGVGDIATNGPPAGSTPPGAGGTAVQAPKTACDISFGFVSIISLKWIVCPIVNLLMSTVSWLEDFLVSQLNIDTAPLDASKGNGVAYHTVWASFRTIALAIIVIVALVMVIFEATGVEAVSAYTMRSLFTRFGVAVLFIVLSWAILSAAVDAVNAITDGARTLIYAPFNSLPKADLSGGSSAMLLLLGTGGILALGPGGLLSLVATALLTIFITVMVLVIVHALIYILIMVSPVAIALSVLPNTRKGYDFWKNALLSLFLGLIAVAFAMPALDVVAASTYSQGGGGTLYQIIALILKFMRVFIVLFIFSRVGGVLGNISGMVNDRGRGAFDRLKKFRGNRINNNMQAMGRGERFKGNNAVSNAFNTGTRGAAAFSKSGAKMSMLTGNRQAWSSAMEQQKSLNAINYAKTDQAQVGQHNDDMLRAQTFKNETEARAQMGQRFDMDTEAVDNAIQQAKVNGGFSANKQVYAARQLAKTGTGYNNLEQVHATVAGISGNNKAMADSLIGSINSDTKGAGRFDLAAGFGTHQGLYKATLAHNQAENAFSSAQAAHQSGQLSNADFQVATANAQVADAEYAEHIKQGYVSAVKGTGTIEMLRSKPIAQDNVMPALSEALYDARNTAANDHAGYNAEGQSLQLLAQEEAGRLSTVVENYKQSTAYASPQVAQKFDDNAYIPTTSERREVKQESSMVSPNAVTYDRVTGQPSIQYERRDSTPVYDTSGAVVRDASGAPVRNIVRDASGAPVREVLVDRQGTPIPLANPNYREDVANGVNEQSSRPLFPPGDPRNPS